MNCYDEFKRNYQYQKLKEEFIYIIDLINQHSQQDKDLLNFNKEMLEKDYAFKNQEIHQIIAQLESKLWRLGLGKFGF